MSVSSLLKLLSIINEGPDNSCTYELTQLPYHPDILVALRSEFGHGVNLRTGVPYEAKDWNLSVKHLGNDLKVVMVPVIHKWAFAMRFSPKFEQSREWVKEAAVDYICDELGKSLGPCEIYEVVLSPPVWYESYWQDIAFQADNRSWLLHLGVSD